MQTQSPTRNDIAQRVSRRSTVRRAGAYQAVLRAGTTILEVLFAIGIVVIGVLGIASLLPLAARNANLANEASEGQSYSQRYYADFMVRGFSDSSRWQWFNDIPGTKSFVAYSHASVPPIPTGTSAGGIRVNNRHAICIDPGYFADALTLSEIAAGTFAPAQAYRPGLFPYYQDNFNPLSNPALPAFYTGGGAVDDRARLLRVSVSDPFSGGVFRAKQVEQMFLSSDDLAIATDDDDKTIAPTRVYDLSGGRALSTLQYSWLATLVPREYGLNEIPSNAFPETRYTLSIVVMHRRDRSFFIPTGSFKNDLPQGERVLAITGNPGSFRGGNGGTITVSCNNEMDDTLRVGDWMLLTRHSTGPERATIARWYRIIGGDPESTVAPVGGVDVWSKNIVIEGPDWVFSGSDQATVVSNVVTVLERVVDVR